MNSSLLRTAGVVFAVFLILVPQAFAANVATSDVTNQAQAKPWHILLDVSHSPAARDDQFSSTDYTFFFDYQLNAQHLFRVLQAPTEIYETGLVQGENQHMASETLLSHFWNTGWKTGPFKYRLVSTLGLPTSIEAQDNDKMAMFTETVQINAMFFGKLVFSLRPFVRYNWYEFKTTESGFLLPTFIYGVNLVTSFSLTDKLSLNGSFGYSQVNELASQYDDTRNFGIFEENAEGRYFLSLTANYSVSDKFGVYAGYTQGDTYIRDGRFEVYAYDPIIARYNIGATLYF